ncbi:hypothetical protein BWU74_18935 [Paraburkholderia caledonica]|nr:hypothetical protein BWU74_18935 [Burkholderia sp. Bk]
MKFVISLALTPFVPIVPIFSILSPIVAIIAVMRPAGSSTTILPFDEHLVGFCWVELPHNEAQIKYSPLARRNGAERYRQTSRALEISAQEYDATNHDIISVRIAKIFDRKRDKQYRAVLYRGTR